MTKTDKWESLSKLYHEVKNTSRQRTKAIMDSLFDAVYHDKLAQLTDKEKEVFLEILIFNSSDDRFNDLAYYLVDSETLDEV
jgi:succinate dehydrogenase flavin-adding protein (antitoxin of CptAB toxin-antitoxin module)